MKNIIKLSVVLIISVFLFGYYPIDGYRTTKIARLLYLQKLKGSGNKITKIPPGALHNLDYVQLNLKKHHNKDIDGFLVKDDELSKKIQKLFRRFKKMKDVVIVSGSRTAIGAFGGGLKTVPVVKLGSIVMKDVLKRIKLKPVKNEEMQEAAPDKLKDQGMVDLEKKSYDFDDGFAPVTIDEVIMGNVLQAGQGQNTARQSMISAGIPKETPAFTINKVCGSGLKAIALGASAIMTGESDVVLAGGQENMSMAPMALPKARWGHRMELTGIGDIYDLMVFDGLYEIFYGYHMGLTAENIASMYDIGRQEQDELGVLSHLRARKAIEDGTFSQEIVPVVI